MLYLKFSSIFKNIQSVEFFAYKNLLSNKFVKLFILFLYKYQTYLLFLNLNQTKSSFKVKKNKIYRINPSVEFFFYNF